MRWSNPDVDGSISVYDPNQQGRLCEMGEAMGR